MEDKKRGIRKWTIALSFKLLLTLLHESLVSKTTPFLKLGQLIS